MFKYLVLIFTSAICMASEPKFYYRDCVKITEGFYKDCSGRVTDYVPGNNSKGPSYTVSVEICKGDHFYRDFEESQLEACKK